MKISVQDGDTTYTVEFSQTKDGKYLLTAPAVRVKMGVESYTLGQGALFSTFETMLASAIWKHIGGPNEPR